MKIRPARGLIGLLLRRTGFAGITLPFGIYILPERFNDVGLRKHELVHAEQIERLGMVRFYVTYLYQVIRYTYQDAPLEKEARERSETR